MGPHVVGRRIVVRHLLPDGRASDVLGVCTAWDEASLTIDRDGHGPVVISLSTVVTGKPVPPRASVRARVGAAAVERHVEALWSRVTTEPLGTKLADYSLMTWGPDGDWSEKKPHFCWPVSASLRNLPERQGPARGTRRPAWCPCSSRGPRH